MGAALSLSTNPTGAQTSKRSMCSAFAVSLMQPEKACFVSWQFGKKHIGPFAFNLRYRW